VPQLTPSALRKQIAAGETAPLYVLIGEDDVEKSAVAGEFAGLVEEGLQAFNVDRLYGGEIKVDDLVQTTALLPMMALRRVVIVLEAEKLFIPKRESKAADEEQERLVGFLDDPPPHATTVFVCSAVDRRRTSFKKLFQVAQVVDCGTVGDASDAERWVRARASALKVSLEPAAISALIERAGLNLARLRAGLERLSLYCMGQKTIAADDVWQVVPAGSEMPENFGMANAIERNDAANALHQLRLSLDGGTRPEMVLGQLRFAAERLPGSRVRSAIDAVFRTDLALKSSGGEPRRLLERLIVELCGDRRPTRRV
jgi:DNA polymerase-3 subunit delta